MIPGSLRLPRKGRSLLLRLLLFHSLSSPTSPLAPSLAAAGNLPLGRLFATSPSLSISPPSSSPLAPSSSLHPVLIVGDGDLSFGSLFTSSSPLPSLSLFDPPSSAPTIVTVLESEKAHRLTYLNSSSNSLAIASRPNCTVHYSVDATDLPSFISTLPPSSSPFSRIIWNFPHVPGKMNIKHNRALLLQFFFSAASALSPSGTVEIALFSNQGGMASTTLSSWRQSWQPAALAAAAGLLLVKVEPYDTVAAEYSLSSHRGVDRQFTGSRPLMHTFSLPSHGPGATPDTQMCSYNELHLLFPEDSEPLSPGAVEAEIVSGAVERTGLECDVEFQEVFREPARPGEKSAVYRLCYRGVTEAVTRERVEGVAKRVVESARERGREGGEFEVRESVGDRRCSNAIPIGLFDALTESYEAEER